MDPWHYANFEKVSADERWFNHIVAVLVFLAWIKVRIINMIQT